MGLISLPLIALGPLGEELGWRGFLLPRMLERLGPLAAALIVGTIWMAWHIPAFLMSGLPQSTMSFPIFVVGGIALSLFITWLFIHARQSVLVAGIIPHAMANAWGDAIGPMTWINAAVLVLGAILLVWSGGLRNPDAPQVLNGRLGEALPKPKNAVSDGSTALNSLAAVRHIFDESGDVVGIVADDLPYLIDGKTIPMKWIGRFRDYASFGAYRLPSSGEIAWVLPEGEYVYWKGTVTGVDAAD